METIFMSGRWFRRNFHVESFSKSLIQESPIIHRSELSEDHFHEWAMISSKFSCRDILRSLIQENHNIYRIELSGDHFLELALISSKISTREFLVIYNTREPHQSQKWAIWRQFSKSSPTHENGLQIAHFCEWWGSLVLKISRNSRHENFDEIIAHSWKLSPDSSLLWLMWLSCIIDHKKFSSGNFGRNQRQLKKMVSR